MSTGGVTQFGRACKLLVSNGNSALDLSEFRIQFQVHGTDLPTPNMAQIRVYNLAASTVAGIINGYNSVFWGNTCPHIMKCLSSSHFSY